MKQNIFKTTIMMIGFLIASTSFAATMNQSFADGTKAPNAAVSKIPGGAQITAPSASVKAGDRIWISTAYALNKGPAATNATMKIENLDGRSFKAGTSETVTTRVTGGNYSPSTGSIRLNFQENVKLVFVTSSWQKQDCSNFRCSNNTPGGERSLITGGTNIGTVQNDANHYKGGAVAEYMAIADNTPEPPTYDNCTFNGKTIKHGATVNAFQQNHVPYGQSCKAQTRKCNDGVLSGSYKYSTCNVGPKPPTPGGDEAEVRTDSATNVDDDSAVLRGTVLEGDDVDVYFVLSSSDTTPECKNTNDTLVNVSSDFDAGERFSRTVNGLVENTRYYYRACGIGQDGETDEGAVREFVTDQEGGSTGDREAEVRTNAATNVDEDSAVLRGEVEQGDNVDVYFVLSSSDTTPECKNTNDTLVEVSGSRDRGDAFSRTVTGLRDNTRYYYRACGIGEDGETDDGNVREFVTDQGDGKGNPTPPTTDPYTLTSTASNIGRTQATLNSYVFGEGNGVCYFEYGRGTSLGLTSPRVAVDLDRTTRCSSPRTGLLSGETYYYRSVLVVDGRTYYGSTRSFRTDRVVTNPRPPVVHPRPPVTYPRPHPPVTVVDVELEEFEDENCLALEKSVSNEYDSRFSDFTRADRGDMVYYKVRLTNVCRDSVEDVLLIDRIPYYLELDDKEALNDDDEKTVGWTVERLRSGQSRTYVTEMMVRDDAPMGDNITSYATASSEEFSVNSNDVTIEVDDDRFTDDEDQAASIFGAGFWPTSLFGWLLLILVILAIIYFVSRMLAVRNENARTLAELRAAQAARNNA